MAENYFSHLGYTLKLETEYGQYRIIYWRANTYLAQRYETIWTDTPEEARRLAKLTIASLIASPVPNRARFAEGEA